MFEVDRRRNYRVCHQRPPEFGLTHKSISGDKNITSQDHLMKIIKNLSSRMRLTTLGLAIGISLSSFGFDLPVKTVNGQKCFYYTVGTHDTSLSIAKALGVSVTEIYLYNQSASDGVKRGQVLYFPYDKFKGRFNPMSSVSEENFKPDAKAQIIHVVEKGDTLFGISKKYGVPTDQLVKLNPATATGGVKIGQRLVISVSDDNKAATSSTSNVTATSANDNTTSSASVATATNHKPKVQEHSIPPIPEQTNELTPVRPSVAVVNEDTVITQHDKSKEQTIAVLLPFELNEEKANKQSSLVTDFYRGALLGANAMSVISDKVTIKTYDTGETVQDIDKVLNNPDMGSVSIIVGPYSPAQFSRVARYGASHGIYVLNPFIVKDTTYIDNPFVVQTYIDTDRMYDKAADCFMQYVSDGYTPVILSNSGERQDKEAFISIINDRLAQAGITPLKISYDGYMAYDDITDRLTPTSNYIFLPESGSVGEFNKFCTPLAKYFNEDLTAGGFRGVLFGYPEWAAFKGRPLEHLAKLNATFFSRFNIDHNSDRYREMDESFKKWYGQSMIAGFPIQAIQGYDLMEYLLATLRLTGSDLKQSRPYEGVQAAYDFKIHDGASGLANDALYLISFMPDGSVTSIIK